MPGVNLAGITAALAQTFRFGPTVIDALKAHAARRDELKVMVEAAADQAIAESPDGTVPANITLPAPARRAGWRDPNPRGPYRGFGQISRQLQQAERDRRTPS